MPLLNPGDHFPPITVTPVDGEPIDLPDALVLASDAGRGLLLPGKGAVN